MNFKAVSASEAVRLVGLKSVAMLDYLERSEVLVRSARRASGRGRHRAYDFRDLLVLKVIASLLRNGASVAAVKKALREFQQERWQADVASLGFGEQRIRYLIVSGDRILFATGRDSFFDITAGGQLAFNFVVDLDFLHTELCTAVSQREFEFLRA